MKQLKIALKILGIGLVCLIPTPTYGKHGGFFRESKEPPIDVMDAAFENHDHKLSRAYNTWQKEIREANVSLIRSLESIPSPNSWYGKVYRKFSIFTFKIGRKIV